MYCLNGVRCCINKCMYGGKYLLKIYFPFGLRAKWIWTYLFNSQWAKWKRINQFECDWWWFGRFVSLNMPNASHCIALECILQWNWIAYKLIGDVTFGRSKFELHVIKIIKMIDGGMELIQWHSQMIIISSYSLKY